jgi:hypothetical protein
VVPDCSQDVRLNVSAVNICGKGGASVSDIEPKFMERPTASAPTTESSSTSTPTSESNSTSASTERSSAPQFTTSSTLCAVLPIILLFMRS